MSVARRVSAAVCLVLPALLALSSDAGPQPPATNTLYGFINANRTLTLTAPGPTYEVLGDLVIQPGVTLTVEPGVTLRFAANHDTLQGGDYLDKAEILVLGSLVARGNVTDSIRFVSSDGSPNSWGRIKVQSAGDLSLFRCSIRGCIQGVYAPSGTATIQASLFVGGHSTTNTETYVGIQGGANVNTTAPDTSSVEATIVSGFSYGCIGIPARNIVALRCYHGFNCPFVTYCTGAYNARGIVGNSVLNSIAAHNAEFGAAGFFVDHSDLWNTASGWNLANGSVAGDFIASFNPFFINPAEDDFRLAPNSIFKNYSNTGWEIGAYGPGNTPPVAAKVTSWGRIKALYR